MKRFVVVTGLPASGKSTVGACVAEALALPLLDKDQILEVLFEALGIGDAQWRTRLSRAADEVLQGLAMRSQGAVIASWWRHPLSEFASGTSPDWLRSLPGEVIELHCKCSPHIAVERFFARTRHSGHLDGSKSKLEELAKFEQLAAHGALGVGRVVEVNTEQQLQLGALVYRLQPPGANPSIVRTATAKPASAAHVERYPAQQGSRATVALLVIDMLNDFFRQHASLAARRDELVRSINQLASAFRAQGQPVYWVRQEFTPDLSDAFTAMRRHGIRTTIAGTDGCEILPELDRLPTDTVFVKKRYSAFFGTGLDRLLSTANQPLTLVVAGINTHACIRTTAIDAYQRDLDVVIAADCVSSYDLEHHEVTRRYLDLHIAPFRTNQEIIDLLEHSN